MCSKKFLPFSNDAKPSYFSDIPENNNDVNNIQLLGYTRSHSNVTNSPGSQIARTKSTRSMKKPNYSNEYVCTNTYTQHCCNLVSYHATMLVIII